MSFNSLSFLIFFPITTLIYFLADKKFKWLILLFASVAFYTFYSLYLFLVPVAIALATFYGGKLIAKSKNQHKKYYLFLSCLICLSILFTFKYVNFLSNNLISLSQYLGLNVNIPKLSLVLPLGISFYTFQSLSYVFEVYRKNVKTEKSFSKYFLFVIFFPLVLSGPIERANRLLPQLKKLGDFNYEQVTFGLKLIVWGLFKKVVIADRLAVLVEQIYKNPYDYSGAPLALATFFFVYQLYCDFSGYSDIARGVSLIFGIKVINNFNSPFASKSVSEFWRKWHISLSSYLNDYLYTPLALNLRNLKNLGIIISIFVTFVLIGFWHGANWTFGIFGLLQAVAISYEILTKKIRQKIFKNIPLNIYSKISLFSTFVFWNFSCIFFRANSLQDVIYIIKNLFKWMPIQEILAKSLGLPLKEILLGFVAIGLLELVQYINRNKNVKALLTSKPIWLRYSAYYIIILAIILLGKFGQNKFIYFNF